MTQQEADVDTYDSKYTFSGDKKKRGQRLRDYHVLFANIVVLGARVIGLDGLRRAR